MRLLMPNASEFDPVEVPSDFSHGSAIFTTDPALHLHGPGTFREKRKISKPNVLEDVSISKY